jgi:GTPase SAR1 family protein
MVLLLGQYSVGKTTFIKYIIEDSFPGERVGPEPTTEKFVAIMGGKEERLTPGHAAAISSEFPFSGLQKFGGSFLNKFEVAQINNPIMERLMLVDTPGVLSGEKQRIGRSYEFSDVVKWFASKADRIILLFDAHKLDISDEFQEAINALKGNDDKVRVVLNKADKVGKQELMRIYGALMWSLGRVIASPEAPRVYIGKLNVKPPKFIITNI